jgi:hypothetical protein
MLPPPGEACHLAVEVERERNVAGEVFFKKGHMAFDWRRAASMANSEYQGFHFFGGTESIDRWRVCERQDREAER